RARLYERIAPIRRAVRVVAPSSPALRDGLASITAAHRREVAAIFAAELEANDSRRELLAALDVATSFDTWDHLRRAQGCSIAVSRNVVARLIKGALMEAG